jgi:hypothetical protein
VLVRRQAAGERALGVPLHLPGLLLKRKRSQLTSR